VFSFGTVLWCWVGWNPEGGRTRTSHPAGEGGRGLGGCAVDAGWGGFVGGDRAVGPAPSPGYTRRAGAQTRPHPPHVAAPRRHGATGAAVCLRVPVRVAATQARPPPSAPGAGDRPARRRRRAGPRLGRPRRRPSIWIRGDTRYIDICARVMPRKRLFDRRYKYGGRVRVTIIITQLWSFWVVLFILLGRKQKHSPV
jgi:hypothetical protein